MHAKSLGGGVSAPVLPVGVVPVSGGGRLSATDSQKHWLRPGDGLLGSLAQLVGLRRLDAP